MEQATAKAKTMKIIRRLNDVTPQEWDNVRNKCSHSKAKKKLTAWAIDFKGRHKQGFKYQLCCANCGEIIKDKL